jgi:hypothetical protein
VNNKKVFDNCSFTFWLLPSLVERNKGKKVEKDKRRVEKKKGNSLFSLHFSTDSPQ